MRHTRVLKKNEIIYLCIYESKSYEFHHFATIFVNVNNAETTTKSAHIPSPRHHSKAQLTRHHRYYCTTTSTLSTNAGYRTRQITQNLPRSFLSRSSAACINLDMFWKAASIFLAKVNAPNRKIHKIISIFSLVYLRRTVYFCSKQLGT